MSYNSNFTNLAGYWTATKNIHIIKSNKRYTYKENVYITKNSNIKKNIVNEIYNLLYYNEEKTDYTNYNQKKIIGNNIKSISKLFDREYLIKDNQNQYTKLQCLNNNIQYNEYIYSINQNLKVSVATIKNFNFYIGIIFTSYIKKYPQIK